MPELWIDPNLFVLVLLVLGGILLGTTGLLAGRGRAWPRRVWLGSAIGLLALGGAAAVAGQPKELWFPPAVGGAGVFGLLVLQHSWTKWAAERSFRFAGQPWFQGSLLLVAGPLGAVWYVERLIAPDFDDSTVLATGVEDWGDKNQLVAVDPTPGRTDRGRHVKLEVHASPAEGVPPEREASELAKLQQWGLSARLIRTAPADDRYNCHGWTFTGGRYWIRAPGEVQKILDDNGYRPVVQPRAGDVAVYREPDGQIIHTGVVRGVGSDGVALVESKWGFLGRFIHTPDGSCYKVPCTFYRTDRPGGHTLRGVEPPANEPATGTAAGEAL